jgi:hypothetical protein
MAILVLGFFYKRFGKTTFMQTLPFTDLSLCKYWLYCLTAIFLLLPIPEIYSQDSLIIKDTKSLVNVLGGGLHYTLSDATLENITLMPSITYNHKFSDVLILHTALSVTNIASFVDMASNDSKLISSSLMVDCSIKFAPLAFLGVSNILYIGVGATIRQHLYMATIEIPTMNDRYIFWQQYALGGTVMVEYLFRLTARTDISLQAQIHGFLPPFANTTNAPTAMPDLLFAPRALSLGAFLRVGW